MRIQIKFNFMGKKLQFNSININLSLKKFTFLRQYIHSSCAQCPLYETSIVSKNVQLYQTTVQMHMEEHMQVI